MDSLSLALMTKKWSARCWYYAASCFAIVVHKISFSIEFGGFLGFPSNNGPVGTRIHCYAQWIGTFYGFIFQISAFILKNLKSSVLWNCVGKIRRWQRDDVYIGWPIAPSYMSPNAGEGWGGGSRPTSTVVHNAQGAQINFGDLIPYLTLVGFGRACAPVRCAHPSS